MKKYIAAFFILILLLSSISFAALTQKMDEGEEGGGTAAISTTHIYLNGKLVESINSDGTKQFYHQDYLGSTRIITNVNGSLVARIDYDVFGRELVDTTKTKYTFTGKEQDSTRLQYFGARYYDADTGRFTQNDPRYDPAASAYAYVENNPLIKTDPTGEYSWEQFKTDWNYAWETGPIMNLWRSYTFTLDWTMQKLEEHQNDIDAFTINLATMPPVAAAGKGVSEAITIERYFTKMSAAERGLAASEVPKWITHIRDMRGIALRAAKALNIDISKGSIMRNILEKHDFSKSNRLFKAASGIYKAAKVPRFLRFLISGTHSRLPQNLHHITEHMDELITLPENMRMAIGTEYASDWFSASMGHGVPRTAEQAAEAFSKYGLKPLQDLVGETNANRIFEAVRNAATRSH